MEFANREMYEASITGMADNVIYYSLIAAVCTDKQRKGLFFEWVWESIRS